MRVSTRTTIKRTKAKNVEQGKHGEDEGKDHNGYGEDEGMDLGGVSSLSVDDKLAGPNSLKQMW